MYANYNLTPSDEVTTVNAVALIPVTFGKLNALRKPGAIKIANNWLGKTWKEAKRVARDCINWRRRRASSCVIRPEENNNINKINILIN